MEIKKIIKQDIKYVVEVHKSSFKDFFLTRLGDNFLTIYYDSVRKDDNCIMLGLFVEGQMHGFCAATLLSKGFNKRLLKKNLIPFLFTSVGLLLSKPISLIRLYKNLQKNDPNLQDIGNYAEILSIGVSVDKQGQGFGKKLLIQLEDELNQRGCSRLSLTTDYFNNEKVIEFYKGLGFSIYYDFKAYPNRKMYRLIKTL